MKTYQLYINGEYVDPANNEWFESIDPYRGEAWAKIPRGSKADADKAVKAANEAMWRGPWSKMTASARGKVMRKLGDLVAANAERLAEIEVRDNGKLMAEMLGQLRYHPEWWWYFAGLVDKLEGGLVPIDKPETFAYTTHEPVGVVAALTAWNSPLLFVAWKCAAALAAGCAVIVKPSEFTSASTLEFAALTKEAGIPDGMFNVVTGFGPEIGTELVSHPGVAKITFTGSDATGAKVYETAARSLKRVSLELGGKSPNIVFEDADLAAAASGVISGIFAATGQTCIAGSRLLVQNSIKDKFVERLVELAKSAKIGDPMQSDTNIGPVTTPAQYKKILDYIDIAKAEGARCLLGGKPASGAGIKGGQFVEPTIFTDVDNSHADCARGGVRPGAVDHRLRYRGGCGPYRQRHHLRSGRRDMDQGSRTRHAGAETAAGRDRVGEHLPRHQLHDAVRRHEAFGARARERHRRGPRISGNQERVDFDRNDVPANPFVMR